MGRATDRGRRGAALRREPAGAGVHAPDPRRSELNSKRAPGPSYGWTQLHPCEHLSAQPPAVREHRDSGAVREKLLPRRSQRSEPMPATQQREPKTLAAEPHRDVPAVEEAQLEQTRRPFPPDGERTGVEAPHDPAADAEIHHDADTHPYPDVVHTERPRRQEHERRVVARRGASGRRSADVEGALPSWSDPDSLRAHAEPPRSTARCPHLRLSPQRTGEAGPRGVDQQRAPSRVPHHDRGGRGSVQRQAERTGTERDAPTGRGTRNGCRGHTEDEREERASHLPITVNVSVAV